MLSPSQISTKPRELGGSFKSRSRHGVKLSISDTNHHVTEAIGDMYGDDDADSRRDSRPLSFIASPNHESLESSESYFSNPSWSHTTPNLLPRTASRPPLGTNGKGPSKSHTLPNSMPSHTNFGVEHGRLSPNLSLRENNRSAMSEPTSPQLPLQDIDYESNPNAIAQEFNNLQALRRMSMDVGNISDPDLPSFQGMSIIPSVAPTGGDDEEDPSRLFWVPARVHPELAPQEFKSFLETRVKTIKRRSGELSPEGVERSGSSGGLRRKKSMLSRQIDNSGGRGALGYQDGAEKIERRKSLLNPNHGGEIRLADLTELDELVSDPAKAMEKLALGRTSVDDQGMEVPASDDMPILPAAPGIGLRRSTHTTYRKGGSLRKGERVPFSKRAERAGMRPLDLKDESGSSSSGPAPSPTAENFSRPNRRRRPTMENGELERVPLADRPPDRAPPAKPSEDALTRTKSHQRPEAPPIPQIIQTPPAEDIAEDVQSYPFPERTSSSQQQHPPVAPAPTEPPPRSNRRPVVKRQETSVESIPTVKSNANTMNELSQQPSPLPGNQNTRTDSLTFIPTFAEEKKSDLRGQREKDQDDNASTTSKKGWGWFKGSDDKVKKDKKKDDDSLKKSRVRAGIEKVHDSTRLDVLQHSIEANVQRGRESLLLDRESIDNKLLDERKKESSKKSGKDDKKEKDGIFSSLFGGKRKGEKEGGGKKAASLRALSPDPPRTLRPDVDYGWTRFSLLEERAIYRMAHIKLANPRRPLHSQVLLSNFMYGYLAKVQQMHPHMQIPQSAAQKKQQELERKAKDEQRRREAEQQQQQYKYDYHQGIADYADSVSEHQQQQQGADGPHYVDDSQIYNHDHQDTSGDRRDGWNSNGYSNDQNQYSQQHQYYQYNQQQYQNQHDDKDDMW